MNPAHTLSVSIDCPPSVVAAFVTDPRNMPAWAGGLCKSVRQEGDAWRVDTGEGEVGLRFCGPTAHGILDHEITMAPDLTLYIPMRVVPNGAGSEVLFTLFQPPGMTDIRRDQDLALVAEDLQRLKALMERRASAKST